VEEAERERAKEERDRAAEEQAWIERERAREREGEREIEDAERRKEAEERRCVYMYIHMYSMRVCLYNVLLFIHIILYLRLYV
jgi:hypothetical protein